MGRRPRTIGRCRCHAEGRMKPTVSRALSVAIRREATPRRAADDRAATRRDNRRDGRRGEPSVPSPRFRRPLADRHRLVLPARQRSSTTASATLRAAGSDCRASTGTRAHACSVSVLVSYGIGEFRRSGQPLGRAARDRRSRNIPAIWPWRRSLVRYSTGTARWLSTPHSWACRSANREIESRASLTPDADLRDLVGPTLNPYFFARPSATMQRDEPDESLALRRQPIPGTAE